MPNHVTTRCKVSGNPEEIARFRSEVFTKNEEGRYDDFLDFNKIIPMPECIRNAQSSSTADDGARLILIASAGGLCFSDDLYGINETKWKHIKEDLNIVSAPAEKIAKAYLEKHPEYQEHGSARLKAVAETGYKDWYDWSCDFWGTKWNSYSPCIESEAPLEFTFDTAWSFPVPIFEKLAEMYPDVHFHCSCFDEGWGFAGEGFYNTPDYGGNEFKFCDADNDMYRCVYNEDPPDEEEEEEGEEAA